MFIIFLTGQSLAVSGSLQLPNSSTPQSTNTSNSTSSATPSLSLSQSATVSPNITTPIQTDAPGMDPKLKQLF